MRPAPSTLRALRTSARARTAARTAPRRAASSSADSKPATDYAKLAGDYAQQAAAYTKSALGPLGERVGGWLGSYRAPVTYNLSVARALLKQVYVAEALAPPQSLGAVRSAYGTLWAHAVSPAWWRAAAQSGELARVGVYALEAYGIYKIGEIIGRRSLVGYSTH